MIETEQELILHLRKYYNPKAIALAGSRVSGNYSPTSDWDVYVVTDEEYNPLSADSDDSSIDVMIVPVATPDKPFETRYHPEQYLKIIHNDIGKSLEEAVNNSLLRYQAGPGSLDAPEYARQKRVMKKYIEKVAGRPEVESYAFYYLSIFFEMAQRAWFQIRNEWPLPPYEALPYLKHHDPEFFANLLALQDAPNLQGKVTAAKAIYKTLFGIAV